MEPVEPRMEMRLTNGSQGTVCGGASFGTCQNCGIVIDPATLCRGFRNGGTTRGTEAFHRCFRVQPFHDKQACGHQSGSANSLTTMHYYISPRREIGI